MSENLENGTNGVLDENKTTNAGLVIDFSELKPEDINVCNSISEMYMNYSGYRVKRIFTEDSDKIPAFYVFYKENTKDSPYAVCMLSSYATAIAAATLAAEVGEWTPDEEEDSEGTDGTDGTEGTEGTDGTNGN